MSIDANKEIIRQYLTAWGRCDTETLKSLLAEDAVTHVSADNKMSSIEFEPESCSTWITAFPDTMLDIDRMVAENDNVSVYWKISATHSGTSFMDMEASGTSVHFGGLEINRLRDGKIVEIWRLSDTVTLMQQLGRSIT